MKKLVPFILIVAFVVCAQPRDVVDDISTSRRNAIVRAAEKVSPAVVSVIVTQTRIVTYDPFGGFGFDEYFRDFFPRRQYRQEVKSMGSGVIISKDGEIVTNAHVVHDASALKVTLPDNREFDAEILGIDPNLDLALLKVDGKDLPVVELGTSEDLMIGEWSIAVGNPFGFLIEDAQPSVTVGVISAVDRNVETSRSQSFDNMIQTDAAINPGNSGGPLVNADGQLIGINTFIFSHSGGSEGIGFARPVDDVSEFIADVKGAPGASALFIRHKVKLGAVAADINATLRVKYGLTHYNGVVIVEVEKGSIAETIGLEVGDVILMAQGKVTRTATVFQRQFEKLGPVVDIVIDRNGNQSRLLYQLK